MRLLPCPACGRHVRSNERDCRFCGAAVTTQGPTLASIALLGLALSACTAAEVPETKQKQPEPTAVDEPEPVPEPPTTAVPVSTTDEPTTAIAEPPTPDSATTTGAEEGTTTGLDAVEDEAKAPTKVKYGAPRPQKKYGAPPKPPGEPEL